MSTTLININRREWNPQTNKHEKPHFDVYIGRRAGTIQHYGNPFSWEPGTLATMRVDSREDSVRCYKEWLDGNMCYAGVEPERRNWILSHLDALRGKKLGCFCVPDLCHGTVLIKLLEETK